MSQGFSKACDIYQGFNYKQSLQTSVGFLTSLKLGDTSFTADLEVGDPTNPTGDKLKVVAVLSGVDWGLGTTDPIYFSGQLSVSNKQSLLELIYKSMTKVDVEFTPTVYEYDPNKRVYYMCMVPATSTTTALKGLLEKSGSDLNVTVADDRSVEVQSPINYAMSIGIVPQEDEVQTISVGASYDKKVVKEWGVKVST